MRQEVAFFFPSVFILLDPIPGYIHGRVQQSEENKGPKWVEPKVLRRSQKGRR